MTRAAIALGSNLGDRSSHLESAIEALAELGVVDAVSPTYETAPIGGPDQGSYLNSVVLLETEMAPAELLDGLLAIERGHGRQRDREVGTARHSISICSSTALPRSIFPVSRCRTPA